jgi:hypothetical protein
LGMKSNLLPLSYSRSLDERKSINEYAQREQTRELGLRRAPRAKFSAIALPTSKLHNSRGSYKVDT